MSRRVVLGIGLFVLVAGCGEDMEVGSISKAATSTIAIDGVTLNGTPGCADGIDGQCAFFNYTYDYLCNSRQAAMTACVTAGVCTAIPSGGCNAFGGGACDYGYVTKAICLDLYRAYCECTCYDTPP